MSTHSRKLVCSACHHSLRLFTQRPHLPLHREFSMGRPQLKYGRQSYGSRMAEALSKTRIRWYAIPAGLGIAFLGAAHFYTVVRRNKAQQEQIDAAKAANSYGSLSEGEQGVGRPKKRKRVRPSGPWYVQATVVKHF
jgi:phosphatidylserine decarboxylase